jgi:uncharacterized protein YbbK (DUF523 family)
MKILALSAGSHSCGISLIENGKIIESNIIYKGNKRTGGIFKNEMLDIPEIKNLSNKIRWVPEIIKMCIRDVLVKFSLSSSFFRF